MIGCDITQQGICNDKKSVAPDMEPLGEYFNIPIYANDPRANSNGLDDIEW
jgi:hypothetical protein